MRPSFKSGAFWILELVLHSAVNGRARLAGGDVRAVDAGDGVVRERLEVLRLQRRGVLGLGGELGPEGEEGGGGGRATIRGGVGGRGCSALLNDGIRTRGSRRFREGREE